MRRIVAHALSHVQPLEISDLRSQSHLDSFARYDDALDEDGVRHRRSSIAAATRSACTVSATSWVRMIRAPPFAAIRCAAIEPPSRCCGSDGVTLEMKRLREAPTRIGSPNERSSPRRATTWCASTTCSPVRAADGASTYPTSRPSSSSDPVGLSTEEENQRWKS